MNKKRIYLIDDTPQHLIKKTHLYTSRNPDQHFSLSAFDDEILKN